MNNAEFTPDNSPWWVQRWIELLDSYRFKKRLERARIYAREGNVLSIDFQGSEVLARVQGSEAEPYQVSLSLIPFHDEDWYYVIQTMSQKAIFSAQLLAGEMPEKIEEVFTQNGLSLFPFSLSDMRSYCTCPDKANPCKHIGAVYYQLADRFREDPFVLFQLRGRTKTQILEAIRTHRRNLGARDGGKIAVPVNLPATATIESEKLPQSREIDQFWHYETPLETGLVAIVPPSDNKTILDLLGTIPLTYEEAQALQQYLQQVYPTVSQQAMVIALGHSAKMLN